MTSSHYEIRICENPACGLRYPLVHEHPFGTRCPLCLGSTKVILTRPLCPEPFWPQSEQNPTPRHWLHAILDNVRSAWNVGAMFRTADGLGVEKLYLCGITPTPENAAVRKTSLGAEESVQWEYARDSVKLAERLKAEGFTLWGLEQDERAVRLGKTDWGTEGETERISTTEEAEKRRGATDGETEKRISTTDETEKRRGATDGMDVANKRIALVVGNEVTGVDPDLLDLCDRVVYIPMRGSKRSLNVEVAFAIAAWVVNEY